ncbi:MAG: sugar ABC transporter permease [Clostridiales bacterium]|jgi:multiple sugar transport system permease protein|nr:sugar ABC transporter permease [Clostridiales bacterium]
MLRKKNNRMIVIFLTPAMLLYLMVFLYPVIRTFIMSLFKVESISQPTGEWSFYGFGNYTDLFSTQLFLTSAGNILKIWFVGGIVVLTLALLFAVILTSGLRLKKFYRTIIYLPNVISAVAMGTMWLNYVYNVDYGIFNNVITAFGGEPVLWTAPGRLFWSMLIGYGFGMVGYHMLIFISGIERISVDLYEASGIEGANVFQKFFYVTLPLLVGVIRSNVVIWTVFTTGFFVWSRIFTSWAVSNDTVTPVTYMYEMVFGGSSAANTVRNTGGGAAIGVMMALMVVIVSVFMNLVTRKDDVEL